MNIELLKGLTDAEITDTETPLNKCGMKSLELVLYSSYS